MAASRVVAKDNNMFDQFLKFLYFRNKRRFHDFFTDDLLQDIPKKVAEGGIEMMAAQREVFASFLYYQAHTVHRRNPTDFINMERKQGVLTEIKLLLTLISGAPRGKEPHPVVGETVAPPDEWETGVKNFKTKTVPTKE